MFRIEVTPAADRDIAKFKGRINRSDFDKLRQTVKGLEEEPRPMGVRKIKGATRAYRIRAGDYRIVYEIYDEERLVLIIQISRRNEGTYHQAFE
jgi:mRNA interferase RelE/StbE